MPAKNLDNDDSSLVHGGFISGSDKPAFAMSPAPNAPVPVLIAVPHAGRDYPAHVLDSLREPRFAQLRLEDRYVDRLAREVASAAGVPIITARAPRAMLDLNRARDDVDWGMIAGKSPGEVPHSQANRRSRSGLGLVPRRLPGFGDIWKSHLTQAELDERIEGIHRPYHASLAQKLERIRDEWGAALLVDFHSMPPLKRRPGEHQVARFVLGDRFGASCDGSLTAYALRSLQAQGWPVAHNRPYSGGFVLDHHSAPNRGIHALQFEICRSTYLDRNLDQPGDGLAPVAALMATLVRDLGAATAKLAQRGHYAQAAE